MRIFIVGSIKINSRLRKKFFINNLFSLESVSSLFSWNFNIVGRYSEFCRKEILKRYKQAVITNNDESPYYEIVKKQVFWVSREEPDSLLFFWQEDHWFICPHKNLFFYLLDEFQKSKAEVLKITHLVDFWEQGPTYRLLADGHLYKEYLIDLDSQRNIWKNNPDSRVISLPGIFKKDFVVGLLENNKSLLLNSKNSVDFELHSEKAVEFLTKRSFIQMVPTFHVLREVFWINQDDRAMDAKSALKIIKLRDAPDLNIRLWRKAVRLILSPRVLAGKIKRKIKKLIKNERAFIKQSKNSRKNF